MVVSNAQTNGNTNNTIDIQSAVVRFAGDSGDGMQLAGTQFTTTSALLGNDIATLPDYPAEIRAPVGTVAGVSGFQINFSSTDIHTPGDAVDALIAMNPAALKAHIADVEHSGIIIVNESEFTKSNLKKAGYAEDENPLNDDALNAKYKIFKIPMTRLNKETLADSGLSTKHINRCKNMFALGLIFYLYDRPLQTTIDYLDNYFGKKKNLPDVAAANINSLKAGYYLGETAEIFPAKYQVHKAQIKPGKYRKITGNEATAVGLVAASKLADVPMTYCTYPITPASDILHNLASLRHYNVKTFQAEDEIAAICSAIGVSFAGKLGVTGTSGPGLALKGEALGLAVMTELPLVIVNVQRGGPSTGLPTKTEQSDLLQAIYGRNGDCPLVVIAAKSPADCFDAAIEATRYAVKYRTPVILLTDGYIANGTEPWLIPDADSFEKIDPRYALPTEDFKPYARDENLARAWAVPGTEKLQHRIGGLEKQELTGNVNYEPENHQQMTLIRAEKIAKVANEYPPLQINGKPSADLLVIGWGGTYGSIKTAVDRAIENGQSVSSIHLRHLNPLPLDLGDIIKRFDKVLIPELNNGQLLGIIRAQFLVDAKGYNKVAGKPFHISQINQAITAMLENKYEATQYSPPELNALLGV